MKAEQNELLTRIGPGTPCGAVLRQYWQPVALLDEFDPLLEPRMAERPMKAVRLMGQDLVLFKNEKGHWGLTEALTWLLVAMKVTVYAAPFMVGNLMLLANASKLPENPPAANCANVSSNAATRC